ncbi:MAG: hypothetical protein QOF50_393 [Gaiellaceae bacterium]|nr:hypothetical protein [Gaiellaceae bacterium]
MILQRTWHTSGVIRAASFALVVASVLAGASYGSARTTARLQLVDAVPLTVRGTGFGAREQVTVVATVEGTTRRKVLTASASGRFLARFARLRATSCPGYFVRATGNHGGRATLKPRPAECPPPPPPLAP